MEELSSSDSDEDDATEPVAVPQAKPVAVPQAKPVRTPSRDEKEESVSYGHISGLFAQEVDACLAGAVQPRKVFNNLRLKHRPAADAPPEAVKRFMMIPSAKQIRERAQTLRRKQLRDKKLHQSREGIPVDEPRDDDDDPPPGTKSGITKAMTVS